MKVDKLSEDDSVLKSEVIAMIDYVSQQTLFEGVQTAYKMEKYQQQLWKALVPVQLVLTWKRIIVHGNVKEVPDDFAYYVDFISQLELVLQCKDILECIENPQVSSDNFIRSALDGYLYQNHPVTTKHPKAIGIIFYLDDALTLESLTSYQDHSIRNYSWTIANITPDLRSSVRAINLLALAKTSIAKKYHNGPILDNFIEGLNRLSSDEGVTLNIRGVLRKFHGFLLFVIGDYPALANLGGWKESAAFAWRFCRQCLVTQNEFRSKFNESEVTMRTAALHEQHLAIMAGGNNDNEEEEDEYNQQEEEPEKPSVKFGVNSKSPLLKVNSFDITKCMPQDIMHLFLEGIMETHCRLLLNHAIEDKKLKLKDINYFLSSHDYGKLQTDKPSPIQPTHLKSGLRQTSSQMLMLSFLLPFILKGHCDPAKLQNYILLLMIFSMCMSHEFDISGVSILTEMIQEYLMKFSILFPDKLTPKHHFLLHLPYQILLFGVLTEQWAMRFEAFFSRLKRLTKLLHNARNLSCSLIIRVCASQSYQIHVHQDCFLSATLVKPKLKEVLSVSKVLHKDCLLSCLGDLGDKSEVSELVSLKWHGSVFSAGDIVMLSSPSLSEDLPLFAVVAQIFCHENKYVFLCRLLKTVAFCEDVNAYHVVSTIDGAIRACDIGKMPQLQQLVCVKSESKTYVLLRRNSKPNYKACL